MTQVVLPLAFDRWPSVEHQPDAARRAYIADELRRLSREGAPLLTVVLAQSDDAVKHIALSLLRSNDDGEGRPIHTLTSWSLRLVEGESPPVRDPQGRMLAKEEQGKVLRVKVGNLGANLGAQADAREIERFSGAARMARSQRGQDLYITRDVTRNAQSFTLDDAVKILSAWGVGVPMRQYDRHPKGTEGERGQCRWLVEEVTAQPVQQPAPGGRRAA